MFGMIGMLITVYVMCIDIIVLGFSTVLLYVSMHKMLKLKYHSTD